MNPLKRACLPPTWPTLGWRAWTTANMRPQRKGTKSQTSQTLDPHHGSRRKDVSTYWDSHCQAHGPRSGPQAAPAYNFAVKGMLNEESFQLMRCFPARLTLLTPVSFAHVSRHDVTYASNLALSISQSHFLHSPPPPRRHSARKVKPIDRSGVHSLSTQTRWWYYFIIPNIVR